MAAIPNSRVGHNSQYLLVYDYLIIIYKFRVT